MIKTVQESVEDYVSAHLLTTTERSALAWIRSSEKNGINADEIVASGKYGPEGDNHRQVMLGQFTEAILSLNRFGFIKGEYDHSSYGLRLDDVNYHKGRWWIYQLTEKGEAVHKQLRTRVRNCCENAVVINCVCMESFSCPEHGSGCIGTHD
jgi:hypothetical protein